jgi:hypothetical protein
VSLPQPSAAADRAVRLVALALLAAPAGPLLGAELYVDGRLGQSFEYDDNIDLVPGGGESAFGSRTTVGATLGVRTPASTYALSSDFRLVRFFTDTDLDSEDVDVDALGSWEWPRTSLRLEAGVTRDTTRELRDIDAGVFVAENEERLTVRASSALSHRFTPLQTGGLNLGFTRQLYPDLDGAELAALGLDEFSHFRANATWGQQVARNLTFLGLLGGSYFDSDRQETTTLQGQLGARYGLTPALDISGTIGPSVAFTDVEEPVARSDTEVAAVWDVNLDYRPSADASVALGLFQQFDPSATGELNLRTGITVGFDYALTRYTLFSLPALIQRQEPVEGVTDTRYFARVQPTLGYQVLPQLRFETSYRFRWESFDDGDIDDATSNAIFLNLRYDLPSLLTSR